MNRRLIIGLCFVAVLNDCLPAISAEPPSESVVETAARLASANRTAAALEQLTRHLQQTPTDTDARDLRARLNDLERNHEAAIADFDLLIQRATAASDSQPAMVARLYNSRGASRFKRGDVAGSIQDFDAAIRLQPSLDRSHWQRGISYYYDGKYDLGAKQFERYQTYDAADVENVVWRFLCQAQAGGRMPAAVTAARKQMLPLSGGDRRVPMMEIDAMFRGTDSEEAVFAAAQAGDPDPVTLNHRLFYAYLYVGLYHEANNAPASARQYLLAADKRKIDHYMWDVAHVHAERIKKP